MERLNSTTVQLFFAHKPAETPQKNAKHTKQLVLQSINFAMSQLVTIIFYIFAAYFGLFTLLA